jgi:polysaccharide deacetylase 2 family uncharacterized protein YibQ
MRSGRRPVRRGRRRPAAARWVVLATIGLGLFVAGLYLGRLDPRPRLPDPPPDRAPDEARSSASGPETSGRAGRPAPTSEDTPPAPVPTEPEHPTRSEPAAVEGPPPPGDGAAVALVIDDLGRSVADLERLGRLGVPVTYAVLPYESRTAEVAAELGRRGAETILHLPMEPSNGADPGPGALTRAMAPAELARATREALAAVPGAVGVNNHMGSGLSADRGSMAAILAVVGERGLYFLDSRTSARSVAYAAARELDVAAAERQVFLDPDPRAAAVRYQFRRLLDAARERGAAIAIGHPHPETLAVLEEEVPLALAHGYRFVPVSYLVDRSSVAAR